MKPKNSQVKWELFATTLSSQIIQNASWSLTCQNTKSEKQVVVINENLIFMNLAVSWNVIATTCRRNYFYIKMNLIFSMNYEGVSVSKIYPGYLRRHVVANIYEIKILIKFMEIPNVICDNMSSQMIGPKY